MGTRLSEDYYDMGILVPWTGLVVMTDPGVLLHNPRSKSTPHRVLLLGIPTHNI